MKGKINLETQTDVNNFLNQVHTIHNDFPNAEIFLENGSGTFKVPVSSELGVRAIAAVEFNDLWLVSETDCYSAFRSFWAE